VVGVSPDSVASHTKFAAKLALNFSILADPERKLIEKLGLWVEKSLYGKKYFGVERSTFLLDEKGKILKALRKVKPEGHAKEVFKLLNGS